MCLWTQPPKMAMWLRKSLEYKDVLQLKADEAPIIAVSAWNGNSLLGQLWPHLLWVILTEPEEPRGLCIQTRVPRL